MSYLSIEFALCFLAFFLLYWLFAGFRRGQNTLLLLASYALLASFSVGFALHLAVYSCVVYALSVLIAYGGHRRFWLLTSLLVSIVNLFVFKYLDFFREYLQALLGFLQLDYLLPAIEIIMPLGISYYTFHSITYLVSVYKKEIRPPSIFEVALFFSFFPTLVAGPINRAVTMLPQIQNPQPRQIGDLNRIFVLLVLAVAKKLWLAAYLADNWVQPILPNANEYHSLTILAAAYAYALQIFLDFSGYTDLMIAIALLLGFNIPENFNRPYAAVNVRDFWQRWHISLSHWIRDYLYIPLGGSRYGFTRTQINLLIAMLLSGLWHGAGLNFVVWGGLHGLAMVWLNISGRFLGRDFLANIAPYLARWLTFHFVCLTWVFFYAANIGDAANILLYFGHNFAAPQLAIDTVGSGTWIFVFAMPLLLAIYPYADRGVAMLQAVFAHMPTLLLPLVLAMLLVVIIMLSPEGIPAFIYASF